MRLRLADPFDTREPYRQTFRSNIDGSVQYYGVKQAATKPGDPPPAVIVTMHGASIEALSHLNHMGGKSWAHLVSPTNRGTYGFDYEDIGRKDALEALADAQQRFKHDPTRVYLSGHSMGGHGTWSIGSLYPNKFAAIGPSAGWISYWSYRGHAPFGDANPLEQILKRSMLASDVEQLSVNLKDRAVYVLHGNVDNNVPADQSRRMAEVLKEFHRDWTYAEEGGSHFWNSKESDSSTACVDWPEMLQCFARHVLPPDAAVRRIEFVTPNPRITSQMHWLTIHSQQRQGELSKVQAHCWPIKREFELTTDNVATLRLDTQHLRTEGPVNVRLDGQQVASSAPDDRGGVWFTRQGETWQATGPPSLKQKGPHRYGPVKEEVDRRFVVVYGTQGTPEENAAMLAKARYDAETYLSRANSSGEIVADTQFAPADYADRTVLLIGNADTNAAWNGLLADSAIKVRRGELQVGDQTFTGDDIATMFVQPRPDSDTASVVAFAGTGPVGMQLTYRWSLFVPFVRYPDCLAVQAAGPTAAPRTLAAGYFGNDWSVASGEFVFPSDSAP
jgi:predicted esterase